MILRRHGEKTECMDFTRGCLTCLGVMVTTNTITNYIVHFPAVTPPPPPPRIARTFSEADDHPSFFRLPSYIRLTLSGSTLFLILSHTCLQSWTKIPSPNVHGSMLSESPTIALDVSGDVCVPLLPPGGP
jgi:hypothetical protein